MWGGGVLFHTVDEAPRSGDGAVPSPSEFLFGCRSQNGEFFCILSRIFTVELLVSTYANIMPVCVTDSETV